MWNHAKGQSAAWLPGLLPSRSASNLSKTWTFLLLVIYEGNTAVVSEDITAWEVALDSEMIQSLSNKYQAQVSEVAFVP